VPPIYFVMAPGPTRFFSALAVVAVFVHAPAPAQNLHMKCKPAQIAFDVPRTWVIDNEQTLFQQGFVVPPVPLYALVASPGRWPPSELYELAPEYLQYLANDSPGVTTPVKSLVAHHAVQEGGLTGSAAALRVGSGRGATSVDELAYEKGDRLWLVIAGCSAACYEINETTITRVVDSVRVGTAA
jgi:hypothetical protein